MNIIFFGTPDFVIPVLDTLDKVGDVIGVVTALDTPQGRKKILTPSPVKAYAQQKNVRTILTPEKIDHGVIETLRNLKADLYVVAAYGKILPQELLLLPRHGAINIHPSLLPKYRGPSPIQTSILNGDTETGVTIIKMDEKMDHGPILAQEKVSLSGIETFADLHVSLFLKAADILQDTITAYTSGKLTPEEQQHESATFCRMITKQDGYFDITTPPDPHTLDRMIRAYYPWPTAWTKVRMKTGEEKSLKLLPNAHVQVEGGKPMSLKDLHNGHPELAKKIEEIILKM